MTERPKPVGLKYSCMTAAKHQEHSPDDVPIIMLHGLGGSKEYWRGISEPLSLETKKKVCIVDLRNHGESPWNSKEFNVVAMTEDINHLINELKASKAIVLGHSLGGKIAVHLALTYPERIEKIIVEDMRPNGVTPEGLKAAAFYCQAVKELEKDIPQGIPEMDAKEAFLILLNKRMQELNPSFKPYESLEYIPIKCSEGKCQLSVNPILLDTLMRNNDELLNECSGHFDGPALFIYGGESNFKVQDDENNIKMLFPNARLVEVEGADHTVHTFEKFTREVIKFINDK